MPPALRRQQHRSFLLFGNAQHSMAQYGKTSYWDERYTKDPEPFDWYQRYGGLKDIVSQYV